MKTLQGYSGKYVHDLLSSASLDYYSFSFANSCNVSPKFFLIAPYLNLCLFLGMNTIWYLPSQQNPYSLHTVVTVKSIRAPLSQKFINVELKKNGVHSRYLNGLEKTIAPIRLSAHLL